MKKSTVIKTLNELPKEFHLDELLDKLILIEKIEKGLEQEKSGEVVSHAQVKKMAEKWLK